MHGQYFCGSYIFLFLNVKNVADSAAAFNNNLLEMTKLDLSIEVAISSQIKLNQYKRLCFREKNYSTH